VASVATAGRRWRAAAELGSAACPGERVERQLSVPSTCEALSVMVVVVLFLLSYCGEMADYLVGRRRTLLVREVVVGWMVRDDAVWVFVCV
jgi:hypothetical protein